MADPNTLINGVDYSWDRPGGAALAAAGMTFACRYLSPDDSKNISRAEADDLAAHDVWTVLVFEDTPQRPVSGHDAGVADAQTALAQATAAGMPANRPIYFAVDFDVTADQQAAVDAYLQGAASVLGSDLTGVYGGYHLIGHVLDTGACRWAWQTDAWSPRDAASSVQWDPRAQLRQTSSTVSIGGADCDPDTATAADYGQWMPGRLPAAATDIRRPPTMQLVTRTEWGAPATTPAADMPTARGVKIHWIGGPYTTPDHSSCAAEVRSIRQEHLNDPVQHWVDIAYNAVVCQHGYVFEGRGLHKESGANGNQPLNLAHYAICAIQGTNEDASATLKNGLRDAIEWFQANGAGNEILGHRDGYSTDCPGDELYEWVHSGAPRPGDSSPTPPSRPAPVPHPSGPAWPGEYLRVQSPMLHDSNVRTWQQRMSDRGWHITADGWYGPASAAICRQFQTEKGLTVDGIVGPATWACAFRTDNVI